MTDHGPQTAPAVPPKTGMRPGIRILLIVSLAFNLLILGVVAGGMLDGRRPGGMGGADMTLGAYARALDFEDRRAIGRDLHERMQSRPVRGAERAQAMADFLAAISADPFDPAAVELLFEEQRDRATGAMRVGQEALLARVAAMTPAERAEFAARLSHELGSGRRSR